MPDYPNVPVAPGAPPVLRTPQQAIQEVGIVVADAVQIYQLFQGPQWGLFLMDEVQTPALLADSVISVEVRADSTVATAPQEQGAFQSYDKVQVPYMVRIVFGISGGAYLPIGSVFGIDLPTFGLGSLGTGIGDPASKRNQFLTDIERDRTIPLLLTAITPDQSFFPVTVIHYDYRRTAVNGATLLQVDVWLQQVRITGGFQFTNDTLQDSSAADPGNNGTVAPKGPVGTIPTSGPVGSPIDVPGH